MVSSVNCSSNLQITMGDSALTTTPVRATLIRASKEKLSDYYNVNSIFHEKNQLTWQNSPIINPMAPNSLFKPMMSTPSKNHAISPLKFTLKLYDGNSITDSPILPVKLQELSIKSSPKRGLEPEEMSTIGEPESKRICIREKVKPLECPECGCIYSDAKKLRLHRRLHTADSAMLSWLEQEPFNMDAVDLISSI